MTLCNYCSTVNQSAFTNQYVSTLALLLEAKSCSLHTCFSKTLNFFPTMCVCVFLSVLHMFTCILFHKEGSHPHAPVFLRQNGKSIFEQLLNMNSSSSQNEL